METDLIEAVDVLISASPEFVNNFGKYLVPGMETVKYTITLPSPPPSRESNDDVDEYYNMVDEEIDENPSLGMLPKAQTTIKRSISCQNESDHMKPTGRGNRSKQTQLEDDELLFLPMRELNLRLQGLPNDQVKKIKLKRRVLKNRGYAANFRSKTVQQREDFEVTIKAMQRQLNDVKHMLEFYKQECEILRNKCGIMPNRADNNFTSYPSSPDSDIM